MKYKKFLSIAGITASVLLSNSLFAQEVTSTEAVNIESPTQEILVDASKNEIPFFEIVQKGSTTKKAFVFVGGMNDTFNYWDKQIALLKTENPNVEIIGYQGVGVKGTHPHNIEYMENNAQHMAEGIKKLKDSGFNEIEIYAHSLGAVVSKRSLHILDKDNHIDENTHIDFTAVSSPLGGFAVAVLGEFTPFAKPITKFFKLAMAGDMSPTSNFYESISEPLPKKIHTTMIESLDDTVAQPGAAITKERYEKIAATFDDRIVLHGNHEFSSEPKNLADQGIDLFNLNKLQAVSQIKSIRNDSFKESSKESLQAKIS